jgi:hypothetical protein
MKVSKVDAFVGHKGDNVWLGVGDEWPADHPVVMAHPDFFADKPEPAKRGRPLGSKNRPTTDDT